MNENEIGTKVLDAAFKVHSALGPGLLESAYQQCLAFELIRSNLMVEMEVPLPLKYNDV